MTKEIAFDISLATDRDIPWQSVKDLYDSVNWWPQRGENEIRAIVANSIVVGAWSNDELIGFARAVSDGCCRAYLEDVVIHPDCQHHRIGSALIKRLLQELANVDVISLFCETPVTYFYEQLGFKQANQRVLHLKQGS